MPESSRPWWRTESAMLLFLLAAYCLWVGFAVGFRGDHYFLILLSLVCWTMSPATRRFIKALGVFILYWVIYDSMRICPNYEVNDVHIGDLYQLEKTLFGLPSGLTPNEYFGIHHNPVADFLAGVFYLNWVPVPLAFAIYLYFRDKVYYLRFAWAFVATNIVGFVVYYLYPAAPPWFVSDYGFEFLRDTPASPAGLLRFDDLIGFPLFGSIYSKNANIFAAMPSLHSAYPVILLYYGLKRRSGPVNWLFLVFLLGVWFTAVYSNHHYILDVGAGALCALVSVVVFEWLFRQKRVKRSFEAMAAGI